MYFKEDHTFNDICEKSLQQWLTEMESNEDVAVRGGVKLARDYIASLNRRIAYLEEQGRTKDAYLKKLKERQL